MHEADQSCQEEYGENARLPVVRDAEMNVGIILISSYQTIFCLFVCFFVSFFFCFVLFFIVGLFFVVFVFVFCMFVCLFVC